jgi:hypothetical protein
VTAPLPSDLPSPTERRLPTCYLCPRPAARVIGTERMVDFDRDGRLYACALHPLVVDLDVPGWGRCSGGFCDEPVAMGVRRAERSPFGRNLWIVFACGSREHALYDFDLVPVELR